MKLRKYSISTVSIFNTTQSYATKVQCMFARHLCRKVHTESESKVRYRITKQRCHHLCLFIHVQYFFCWEKQNDCTFSDDILHILVSTNVLCLSHPFQECSLAQEASLCSAAIASSVAKRPELRSPTMGVE